MINVRDFFNLILLSISLATVLVTLASYMIFKFRYSFQSKTVKGVKKLEGAFFRRYAPHIDERNQELHEKLKEKQKSGLSPAKKLSLTFGIVAVFILTVLSVENFVTFRSELATRQADAKALRQLIEEGLLKRYELDKTKDKVSLEETLTPEQSVHRDLLIKELRDENIYLISDPTNIKEGRDAHLKAIKRWREFLNRTKIPYQTRNIYSLPSKGFVIAPQLISLSQKKREILLKAKNNKNLYMLFTGYPGQFYSKDDISPLLLEKDIALLDSEVKTQPEKYLPTQIVGSHWLPAGLVLGTTSIDNKFKVVDYKGEILARTSSYYSSKPIFDNGAKAVKLEENIYWSEIDPSSNEDIKKETKSLAYYEDLFFINLMHRALELPTIELSPWKSKEKKLAMFIGVDSEEEFENIDRFMEAFEEYEVKGNFFLMSGLLKEYKGNIRAKDLFEFGSHSVEHDNMANLTLGQNFSMVMRSRFDIEERTHRRVLGFRPPEENINETSLSALFQNNIYYIFGDKTQLQFSPFLLNDNNNVFFPRTLRDDINLVNNKLLVGPEDMLGELKADVGWIRGVRGLHSLSFHSHILGNPLYEEVLVGFLKWLKENKNEIWITHASELARWHEFKMKFKVSFEPRSFKVTNGANFSMENFELNLRNLPSRCFTRKGQTVHFKVDRIAPKQTLEFPICSNPQFQARQVKE